MTSEEQRKQKIKQEKLAKALKDNLKKKKNTAKVT